MSQEKTAFKVLAATAYVKRLGEATYIPMHHTPLVYETRYCPGIGKLPTHVVIDDMSLAIIQIGSEGFNRPHFAIDCIGESLPSYLEEGLYHHFRQPVAVTRLRLHINAEPEGLTPSEEIERHILSICAMRWP